jgi:iron-sulfur cluster repair protein YtfE (RIC family)
MTPETARQLLLTQHEALRRQIETCTRLARLFRNCEPVGRELDFALEVLREEFAAHNDTETVLIRRLLHSPASWSSQMIDRMLEEHVAEHAAFWELLSGRREEVAARIDDLADELDAHMAAEERTFLAPMTLRQETLAARTRSAH